VAGSGGVESRHVAKNNDGLEHSTSDDGWVSIEDMRYRLVLAYVQ
jgi:hypothetical protein